MRKNFEVILGIFSVLVFQISILDKLFRYLSVLKLVVKKNVKILIIQAFKSKFCQYVVFTKKILHGFVSFCISLIFMYCLFTENKIGDD